MTKGVYIGNDSKAVKVKSLYVGVDGKARKVKKGYVGVGGVARQFYSAETIIPFSTSVVPTEWTDGTEKREASATNDYGTWNISATKMKVTSGRVSEAFDGSTNTKAALKSSINLGDSVYLTLECPEGVSINPSVITVTHAYCKKGPVQGRRSDGTWVTLGTIPVSTSATTETFNISNSEFYTSFRIDCIAYGNSYGSEIYEFSINSGKLKIL